MHGLCTAYIQYVQVAYSVISFYDGLRQRSLRANPVSAKWVIFDERGVTLFLSGQGRRGVTLRVDWADGEWHSAWTGSTSNYTLYWFGWRAETLHVDYGDGWWHFMQSGVTGCDAMCGLGWRQWHFIWTGSTSNDTPQVLGRWVVTILIDWGEGQRLFMLTMAMDSDTLCGLGNDNQCGLGWLEVSLNVDWGNEQWHYMWTWATGSDTPCGPGQRAVTLHVDLGDAQWHSMWTWLHVPCFTYVQKNVYPINILKVHKQINWRWRRCTNVVKVIPIYTVQ